MEAGVDVDPNLEVTDPSVLFDFYLNTCPGQGSRTIRTEVGLISAGARCLCAQGSAAFLPLVVTQVAHVLLPTVTPQQRAVACPVLLREPRF